MRMIKEFDEYVKKGVVKKQKPDKSRAEFLVKDSEESYSILVELVDKIKLNDKTANLVVKNAYDIVMQLIRARMLLNGFSSSGFGAHEAEVSYLKELNFSENEVSFANELRYFRNGIMYYGKKFDKDYALKALDFLKKIRKRFLR